MRTSRAARMPCWGNHTTAATSWGACGRTPRIGGRLATQLVRMYWGVAPTTFQRALFMCCQGIGNLTRDGQSTPEYSEEYVVFICNMWGGGRELCHGGGSFAESLGLFVRSRLSASLASPVASAIGQQAGSDVFIDTHPPSGWIPEQIRSLFPNPVR